MFGPIGREILSLGTIIFAIFAVVSIIGFCVKYRAEIAATGL